MISATHRDLPAEIAAGKFREDLYYRLRVVTLELPPLRAHKEDLAMLVDAFLGQLGARHKHRRASKPRGAGPAAALRLAGERARIAQRDGAQPGAVPTATKSRGGFAGGNSRSTAARLGRAALTEKARRRCVFGRERFSRGQAAVRDRLSEAETGRASLERVARRRRRWDCIGKACRRNCASWEFSVRGSRLRATIDHDHDQAADARDLFWRADKVRAWAVDKAMLEIAGVTMLDASSWIGRKR